jgi:hypothetical protein
MTFFFGKHSLEQMATLDPNLQLVLNEAIKTYDFSILEGFRNKQAQDKAYAEGKSKEQWPNGKHNKYPSKATDLAPADKDGIPWKDSVRFGVMIGHIQSAALRLGIKIRCGLDWDMDGKSEDETFKDLGHIELVL